jgi:hypothetical protein
VVWSVVRRKTVYEFDQRLKQIRIAVKAGSKLGIEITRLDGSSES